MKATVVAILAILAIGAASADWIIDSGSERTGQFATGQELSNACMAAYHQGERRGERRCERSGGYPAKTLPYGPCTHDNVGLPGAGFGLATQRTLTVCE